MPALKGLVIGLGVLIVAGIFLLAYGFYLRLNNTDTKLFTSNAPPAPTVPAAAKTGDRTIPLPPGCVVEEMRPEGDRLFLRIGPAGTCARIMIVDINTGNVFGTLVFKP